MRKKSFIAALVLLPVLSGITLTTLWPAYAEPYYQGRALSWWLKDYHAALRANYPSPSTNDSRELRDEKAIAAMGTNAVPLLLTWISSQEKLNPLQTRYNDLRVKYPRLGLPYWSVPSKNLMAYDGFYAIGREATETARPALTALASKVPSGGAGPPAPANAPAFYAGGVLWALDKSVPLKGGFDPCSVLRPLFFPDPANQPPALPPAPVPGSVWLRASSN